MRWHGYLRVVARGVIVGLLLLVVTGRDLFGEPALAASSPPVLPEGAGSAHVCAAADLTAVTQVGLTDLAPTGPALSGEIRFTNDSGQPCTLVGTPTVQIVDANSATLAVTQVKVSSTAGAGIPVLLEPGGQALVALSWRNFCVQPAPPTPYLVRITLADGGVISAPFDTTPPFVSGNVAPPCGTSTSPSVILVGAFQNVPPAVPHDMRYFPQTGYRIDNATIWDYFNRRGGVPTFGYPTSRTFLFQGFTVQFFQRRIVQLGPDGQARLLNLLDRGLLPYASFNFSTFPSVDSALVATAPDPTNQLAVLAWVQQHAPNVVAGAPVHFDVTFLGTVSTQTAFPNGGDASLLPAIDLELWGIPTSQPMMDANNHNFISLRWQRGIMLYDASCSCTQGILLADYLKAILTGQHLPADLAQEAANSPFLDQYDPNAPNWVHNPSLLPDTNLTNAFTPE